MRTERGWSQAELADRLNVSRQTVNAIETGRYDPSLPLAFTIARLFRLPKMETSGSWYELVRTASPERRVLRGEAVHLAAYSLVLLRYGEERRVKRQEPRGAQRR